MTDIKFYKLWFFLLYTLKFILFTFTFVFLFSLDRHPVFLARRMVQRRKASMPPPLAMPRA